MTAIMIVVGATLIVAGWALHIPLLTSFLPGHPATRPISAIAFILAGASLWSLKRSESDRRARLAARAGGLVVTAIGLLSLLAYIVGWPFEVETRPLISSAASFAVVGVVLFLLSVRRPGPTAAAQLLTLPVLFVALAGFVGNLLGASTPSFLTSEPLASGFPATILFLLLSRGILERDPDHGLMAVVMARRPGGIMARRLLVAFTWISLGLGWLLLMGHRSGLYEDDLLVTLFVSSNIALTSVVVWNSARWLNRTDIKRERAEQELGSAASERQQRGAMIQSVLESIGDGVIVVDPGGKRIYNLAAKRILGIDLSGLAVSEWTQKLLVFRPDQKTILPPDEFPTARASRGETVDDMEVFVQHAGAPKGIFVSASARPIRDELGESQGVLAIFRDLTMRRRAEETQRQLAAIVQSTDDAMFSVDVESRVTAWNPGAERLFGLTAEAVMGRDPWPGVRTPEAIERRERATRGERIEPYETEVIGRGGRRVPVLISVSQMRGADGQVVGAAVSVRDITETKRAQEARLRLAAIVESSFDAIIAKDLNGTILSWNTGAERLYGYADSEVLGKNISLLTPPDHADEIPTILNRIKLGQQVEHYETVRRRKNGETVAVSVAVSPVYDSSGAIVGASVIARDISEQRRAEAEIRRLNTDLERRVAERTADLEAANTELEAFTYSVSHDLRAPLRAIHGFVQLLTQRHATQLDAEARRYLERVSAGSMRMSQLIDDLLALSRISHQRLETRMVSTSDIVKRALAQLDPMLQGRAVELSIEALPDCVAEPTLLEQVFANLIGNALKYSRGREPARIIIGSRSDGDASETVFFVKDNGVGFDMRYADKLFGVFQRLHRPEEYEGTGVGLAIVHRIIGRLGGRVWAEAEPDKGASFFFALGGARTSVSKAA
ncbi:MAG: PAS domain S-box protein [Chloroflexi bacterium]|nr:MAG: PAS domain S-box protein [Chloroflexota bacterium]